MDHERALTYALSGGPAPVEAAAHLEACAACRAELPLLREAEAALRRARPAVSASVPALPRRVSLLWPAAAAAALAAGLFAGWLLARGGGPPPSATLAAQTVEAPWTLAPDDSTAALLQVAEPFAEKIATVTPEDAATYMEAQTGGWNG